MLLDYQISFQNCVFHSFYSILYKFSSVSDYSIKHKVFCMADLLVYFVIVLIFVGYLLKWISCTIFYIIHESRTDKYCQVLLLLILLDLGRIFSFFFLFLEIFIDLSCFHLHPQKGIPRQGWGNGTSSLRGRRTTNTVADNIGKPVLAFGKLPGKTVLSN